MDQEYFKSGVMENPYNVILSALSVIPVRHYLVAFLIAFFTFLYNFLEFHFFQDAFSAFRGCPIRLTFHPSSPVYNAVVSRCKILHRRYLATPWMSSPHLQTCLLGPFGKPPPVNYTRQIFHTSDDGTVALDWLINLDGDDFLFNHAISKHVTTPIVVVIPGLTSDSSATYIKNLVFNMAKRGWNVVVSNHRGLGGVSITSDCFYNAGWTEDLRSVVNYLHNRYPKAPIFTIGASIGSNVLVKYLGEDGERTPVAGAAAICNPWDLLIGDRFIGRRLLQRLYDRVLTIGLRGYAQLHEARYSRLANWEGIKKSRSLRDFDIHATCHVGKFETPDTYYRRCSCSQYVANVSVPLLCISALDDPVCTREAIPWDECRANKNIVLATSQHGGHLAFFEGLTATGLWWVRATGEFFDVLSSTPYMHVQKKQTSDLHPVEPSIDHGPYVNIGEDGMVAAVCNEQTGDDTVEDQQKMQKIHDKGTEEMILDVKQKEHSTETKSGLVAKIAQTSGEATNVQDAISPSVASPVKRYFNQLSRQNRRSMWLLAFVAIMSSWPFIGSVLNTIFRKRKRIA